MESWFSCNNTIQNENSECYPQKFFLCVKELENVLIGMNIRMATSIDGNNNEFMKQDGKLLKFMYASCKYVLVEEPCPRRME